MKFNLSSAKKFLEIFYDTNVELANKNITHDNYALMLVGDHGIGKTDMIKQFAKERGVHAEIVRLSQFDEIGQLKGFPIVTVKIAKKFEDEVKYRVIPEKHLSIYIEKGWSPTSDSPIMSDAAPDFISRLKPYDILVFDDFSRSLPFFNNSVMEIIKERKFSGWELPKGVSVFLSSNPDNGEYDVRQLDGAQLDRITPIELEWDKETWIRYAENLEYEGSRLIPDEFINFIYMHPEVVSGHEVVTDKSFTNACSIRKWTNFFIQSNLLYKDIKKDLINIIELGQLHVGNLVHSFASFVNNKYHLIVSSEEIINLKTFDTVVKRINESLELSDNHVMIKNIISFRLSNYLDRYINDRLQVTPELKQRLIDLCNSDLLEKDNKLVILKKLSKDGRFKEVILKSSDSMFLQE
jgi:hypothetical protein